MTVIPLKAQFVSLIITLVFALSEILTLYCLESANSLSESHRLRKGAYVGIKPHRGRSRLFALICLISFIGFEVLVSNFSDPVKSNVIETQDCVVIDQLSRENGTQDVNVRVDIMETKCAMLDNSSFTQMSGNVSMISDVVSCSQQPIFEVQYEWIIEENFLTGAGKILGCYENDCVLAFKQDNLTYFSEVFDADFIERVMDPKKAIGFARTLVFFETEPLLREVAVRAATAMGKNRITDPYEVRRRVFSGARTSQCKMITATVDETSIPLAILVFTTCVFVCCVICSAACICTRQLRISKLDDPMQWACRTFRPGERQEVLHAPVVRAENRDEGVVFVVHDLKGSLKT